DAGDVPERRARRGIVERAPQQSGDGPRIEDGDEQDGRRRHERDEPSRNLIRTAAAQRSTMSVHSSCHCSRLAAISAGSMVYGLVGTTEYLVNSAAKVVSVRAGYTNRLSGSSFWKRELMRKSTSLRASPSWSVPRSTPANST